MSVQIPFPVPSHGYALNSKLRVNLDYIVTQFNNFNTGTATWDNVSIGIANSETGTLTFYNSSNAHYLTFEAGTTAANTTFTLPTGVPSASRKFLNSDTSGTLGWSQIADSASSYTGNLLLYLDSSKVIQELAVGSGNKVLVNSTPPSYFSLTGTTHQISISPGGSAFTFSTPQDIDTTSNVQFNSVQVAGGSATNPSVAVIYSGASVNTGIWSSSGTALDFTVAGTNRMELDNTGTLALTGGVNAPTYRATTSIKLSTSTSGIITLESGATSDYTLTLPAGPGTADYVLKSDGTGILSWANVSLIGGATKALDNLASTAVNADILPGVDSSINLGSGSKKYLGVYASVLAAYTSLTLVGSSGHGTTVFNAADNTGDTQTSLSVAAQGGARTYTVPDSGASASFVMTAGTQSIGGLKTFSDTLTMSGATIAMGSQKITGLASGTASTDAVNFGQIKVISIGAVATSTTEFTTTSSTFQTTNLTASITPSSSSSRILIMATSSAKTDSAGTPVTVTLARGGSNILGTNGAIQIQAPSQTFGLAGCATICYIDSPATTSSTTYAVQIRNNDGTTTVRYGYNSDSQIMILMEIV